MQLTALGIGQSTDWDWWRPHQWDLFHRCFDGFPRRSDTSAVVLIGEIGEGLRSRQRSLLDNMDKPVIAFIAGRTAPPGRRMDTLALSSLAAKGPLEKVAIYVTMELKWHRPQRILGLN